MTFLREPLPFLGAGVVCTVYPQLDPRDLCANQGCTRDAPDCDKAMSQTNALTALAGIWAGRGGPTIAAQGLAGLPVQDRRPQALQES